MRTAGLVRTRIISTFKKFAQVPFYITDCLYAAKAAAKTRNRAGGSFFVRNLGILLQLASLPALATEAVRSCAITRGASDRSYRPKQLPRSAPGTGPRPDGLNSKPQKSRPQVSSANPTAPISRFSHYKYAATGPPGKGTRTAAGRTSAARTRADGLTTRARRQFRGWLPHQ